MKAATEAAYRAWRRAAESGYGASPRVHISDMRRTDARIRRLKERYEQLLLAERPENSLDAELAYRDSIGQERLTVPQFAARFAALGYKLDRAGDARCMARHISGAGARDGCYYPCVTTCLDEADTGLSAFHKDARRDDNYRAMQALRGKIYAVTRGAILEV